MREGRKYIQVEVDRSGMLFEIPVVQSNADGLVVAAIQEEDEWGEEANWAAELTIGAGGPEGGSTG